MKYLCSLFVILLFCGGCTRPPQAELAAARCALAEAYAAGASRLAAEDYKIAARAVQDSETLIHQGRYRKARQLLPFATRHARRARTLARNTQQQQRRVQKKRRTAADAITETAKDYPGSDPAFSPRPPPPTPAQPALSLLSSYGVENGETLWTIAGQPRVYDDPLLWPLLYKANRDQIRDPQQIYSGQVLTIPRDLSSADIEEAHQQARSSNIFPFEQSVSSLSPGNP